MSDSSWLKDLEWVLTPSGKLICTCTELVLIWLISFGPQCQSYKSLMRCYAFVLARAFVWPINKWHQPIIIQLCGWLSIQMCTASRLRPINLHVHSNDMADYYILRPYYVCRPYHSNGKRFAASPWDISYLKGLRFAEVHIWVPAFSYWAYLRVAKCRTFQIALDLTKPNTYRFDHCKLLIQDEGEPGPIRHNPTISVVQEEKYNTLFEQDRSFWREDKVL